MIPKPDPDKLGKVIAESVHQIWSAGIGALSLAEKEGSKFFETLSKLGENIQSHTEKTADMAKQTVSGGKNTATETWDRLEEMFELRVGRALNGLQIPTARDIKELTKRIDKLSQAVAELGAQKAAPKSKKKKSPKTSKKGGKKKGAKTTKKRDKKKARTDTKARKKKKKAGTDTKPRKKRSRT